MTTRMLALVAAARMGGNGLPLWVKADFWHLICNFR